MELLYGCQMITLFLQFDLIGSLIIGYQLMHSSLTIFGIQVVNTENKFRLESTISAYPGPFEYFYSASL